jgi:hypothetical protein
MFSGVKQKQKTADDAKERERQKRIQTLEREAETRPPHVTGRS